MAQREQNFDVGRELRIEVGAHVPGEGVIPGAFA
jgi:hypothetical protein